MSRTKHNSKSLGYEFWSRRSRVLSTGKFAKKLTHRLARLRKKILIRTAYNDPDNVEGRYPGE